MPEQSFVTPDEVMHYLETHIHLACQLYWYNLDKNSLIEQANMFYTDDGHIIAGVALASQYGDEDYVISTYKDLKDYIKPVISCITVEEMCPLNSGEFAEFCRERSMP